MIDLACGNAYFTRKLRKLLPCIKSSVQVDISQSQNDLAKKFDSEQGFKNTNTSSLFATASIDQPPDTMQLLPMPYFVPVVIRDKRRISVPFDMGMGHIEKSTFTIVENQLFPSPVPSEAINLSIFTVDAQLIGYAPQIIGLGGPNDNDTGNGYNPDGSPIDKPIQNLVVICPLKISQKMVIWFFIGTVGGSIINA
jgi:SAM-dependent methyltransferase